MAEHRHEDVNCLGALGLLTVGALIGATVALLLAPKTGEETREYLREKSSDLARRAQEQGSDLARRAQEQGSDLARRAQETVQDAQAKAETYLGRGRDVLEDTSAQLKAAFEAGRSAMRDEINKLRGREEPLEGV